MTLLDVIDELARAAGAERWGPIEKDGNVFLCFTRGGEARRAGFPAAAPTEGIRLTVVATLGDWLPTELRAVPSRAPAPSRRAAVPSRRKRSRAR